MKERTNTTTLNAVILVLAIFGWLCVYLLAFEKITINRPAPLGDYAQLIDEQVEELPAHSLPEVKAELKKFNEGLKHGKTN